MMTKSKKYQKKLAYGIALSLLLSTGMCSSVWADVPINTLPTGGVSGTTTIKDKVYTDAAINTSGNTMNITQNANVNTGYINWGSFNIGSAATVNFKQQSSGQTMVNTVASTGGLSEIYGKMNASGNVVLINANGVLFDGAEVNVGGLAVYASNSMNQEDMMKEAGQAGITIKNSTINAGVGAAIKNAVDTWKIADYAIGIGGNTNHIRLIANGNVDISEGSKLTAVDKTTVTGTTIQGEEEFEMSGNASVAYGQVIIRSDANADDYGTLTINNNAITTTEAHLFYNPEIVGKGTTDDGVDYNIKNYTSTAAVTDAVMNTSAVQQTSVETDSSGLYAKLNSKKINDQYVGSSDANARMLINNIAQLEDIDRTTTGNLAGKYALGKDINAKGDTASYKAVENGVNYLYIVAQEGNEYNITAGNFIKINLDDLTAAPVDTKIKADTMNTANWFDTNGDAKGFNPIGDDSNNPFTGSFDGFGGDATHTISNLVINRGTEDNVGLFGVVSGGSLIRTNLSNSQITGKNNVGGLAGHLTNGGSISWSHNSGNKGISATEAAWKEDNGYVTTGAQNAASNIGGLVGLVDGSSSIQNSSNTATVFGRTADGNVNVTNVGGIAGAMLGNSKGINIANGGNIYGEKDTGGLIGYGKLSQIGVDSTIENLTAASFNKGQVSGTANTGGIAGHIVNTKLHGVYNTNEDAALGANSQYYITADGKIFKQGGTSGTALSGKDFTSADALSKYGQITGGENTGGIAGFMETDGGTNTSEIDTAYNAGNVTGTANVGGLVGKMQGSSTVTRAYNGDNNTVIREGIELGDTIKNIKDKTISGTNTKFTYDEATATYYSFYTVKEDGTKTYYYFIPASGITSKGAGGIYVNKDGEYVAAASLPAEDSRYYLNRMGYKDANVTGTANVGGLIGELAGGTLDTVYNLGSVTNTGASAGTNTGAIAGKVSGSNILVKNSFWVDGKDASVGKDYSKVNTAFGTASNSLAADSKVVEYTIANARDSAKLHEDFGSNYVGLMVDRQEETGYLMYNNGDLLWDNFGKIYTKVNGTITLTYERKPKADGTYNDYYEDKAGNKYTLTDVENSNNKVLKAENGNVVKELTAVEVAGNQSENWLAYQQQTAPMLKYFMNNSNIERVFEYDGTTHNLKTDDVDGLYGRADFAIGSGAGQIVHKDGAVNSDKYAGSSEYYYDNSSIWSPQHGYKMDPKAAVIITPVDLKVEVTGERIYGSLNNVKGYYVCVPYKEGEETKYAFYTVNGTTYNLLTDEQITTLFGDKEANEANLKTIAHDKSQYVVTMNGIIASEATYIDKAVGDVIKTINDSKEVSDLNNNKQNLWGEQGSEQKLTVKNYQFNDDNLTGLEAKNNDYKITYSGNLTVKKATLYYTYDGTREYGSGSASDWGSANDGKYYLTGIDQDSNKDSVNGFLKDWDKDKLTTSTEGNKILLDNVTKKITDNTMKTGGTAITVGKDGTQYHVLRDKDGNVIGYELSDFQDSGMKINGKSDENSNYLSTNYDFKWIAGNTQVKNDSGTTVATANASTQTITPATLTVTVEGERGYGDLMDTSTVDINKNGTTLGGTLTEGTFNTVVSGWKDVDKDNVENLLGNIDADALKALLAKVETSSGSAPTDQINKKTNVKLENGQAAKYNIKDNDTYTKSNVDVENNNILKNSGDYVVKNGNHTLKIDKADLIVKVNGSKIYGEGTITGIANNGSYSFDVGNQLKNNEKFDEKNVIVTNTVTDHDNAGTYNSSTGGNAHKITDVKDDSFADSGSTGFDANNYNISLDENSSYTVSKRDVVFNTSGTKIYGNANPSGDKYTITDASDTVTKPSSGLTSWDKANIFEKNVAGWKNNLTNTVDTTANVGVYGNTDGKAPNNKVITIDATTGQDNNLNTNYNIIYTDSFKVTPRPITVTQNGTKEYGTGNANSSYNTSTGSNIVNTSYGSISLGDIIDKDKEALAKGASVTDDSNRKTEVGIYNNELLGVTISSDAAKNYDITYVTRFEVTPADFTYTADHTEYWQGTPIPGQTGIVTNKYGEDVTDLVGNIKWTTSADTYTPDTYEIIGHGSNDNSGNYKAFQSKNPDNYTALLIKPRPNDQHIDAIQAFGTIRRPLLDIRYLKTADTAGINRWNDSYLLDETNATTLYDKDKRVKYHF